MSDKENGWDLADILAQSREWIEQNGWAQREFQVIEDEWGELDEETGEKDIIGYEVVGYCAMGGVLYSQDIPEEQCGIDPRSRAVAEALTRVLGLQEHHAQICTNDGVCSCVVNWITAWNDEKARTEDEVLDAFMKAEKIERSGDVE